MKAWARMTEQIAMLGVLMLLMLLVVGCLNLGGGRQVVPLPWSQPVISMDGTGVQQKAGRAAGAQMQPGSGGGSEASGDQVITVGQSLTSQRSTDASLADEASQASGRESPGGAADSSIGKEIKGPSISGSASVAPGGVAITAPAPTGSGPAPASAADIAALEEDVAAAQQAVDMLGSGGGAGGEDTEAQAKAKAWLASLQARLAAARRR